MIHIRIYMLTKQPPYDVYEILPCKRRKYEEDDEDGIASLQGRRTSSLYTQSHQQTPLVLQGFS